MSRNKPADAPVPVATRDEIDAWYSRGLLDPAQYTALTADAEADADADAEAA